MNTFLPNVHLRGGGTSVTLDLSRDGAPVITYWGPDLGPLDEDTPRALARGHRLDAISGEIETPGAPSILPLASEGWLGTPGLRGSRTGRDFSPRFVIESVDQTECALDVIATDPETQLDVRWSSRIDATGVFHQQVCIRNTGVTAYTLEHATLTFPVPATATEILDLTGRHLRERFPQRHTLTTGTYARESRRGRPGADATLLVLAGVRAFGFESGYVHGVHLAWSGNHRLSVERSTTGCTILQAGELFDPGEMVLQPGDEYVSPEALGSWGFGLNDLSARFHELVRAQPNHPRRPRPVTLNTWEAMYFGLSPEGIIELADAAAEQGIERFVIDDGWFLGRRDDTTGLGDWFVDTDIFPDGLAPLAEHVLSRGMEFGLWVEPEMVNPSSRLAREHPDWLLQPGGRLPLSARHQQVLDLTNPDAFDYILNRLTAIVSEVPISYLKWDHNRDLLEAGSPRTGHSAVHLQTLALYRLIDTLRSRFPEIEIESCASGGARVDLGILSRTDRIWVSDCIDPIERLPNQRYTGLLVPPELLGMHIGAPRSESTGRTHDLSFRAATALFGHLGVEWDVRLLDTDTQKELTAWIDWHKKLRPLLHTGRVVYGDLADPGADLRGVVAQDGSRALYAFSQVASACSYPPPPVTLPGLQSDARYGISLAGPTPRSGFATQHGPSWAQGEFILTGLVATRAGLRPPVLLPEHTALILCERIDER